MLTATHCDLPIVPKEIAVVLLPLRTQQRATSCLGGEVTCPSFRSRKLPVTPVGVTAGLLWCMWATWGQRNRTQDGGLKSGLRER